MSNKSLTSSLASVVGMNDVLSSKSTKNSAELTSNLFQYFENIVQDCTRQFGYQRIITPIERTNRCCWKRNVLFV